MLVAIAFLAGALVGVAAERTRTPADEWGRGCKIGNTAGWQQALAGRTYDATYLDEGDEDPEFMEGYVWGYGRGWSDGTDRLNNASGNHPINWCSPENRP
jgi:hypothetical protein